MNEKKDVWEILVTKDVLETVVFNKAYTKEEALDLYLKGLYEDVIDEEELNIVDASIG